MDKNGIMVTSMPQADENGVIELNVGKGEGGRITLVVENTGTEEVELKDITLLWKVNFFIYSDISSVGPDRGNLYAGNIFFQLYARLIYITHVIHYYTTVFILGCYDCHHPLYFRLTNQDDSCTMIG